MNVGKRLSGVRSKLRLEERPQQDAMAAAIERMLPGGGSLMVEAGTGVGKSYAYLLPALEYALKEDKKVLVSTHTLTLQEQLFQKDVPVVAKALEREGLGEVRSVLLKGRGNYLSKRRLGMALQAGTQMDLTGEAAEFERLRDWAARTSEGTLSDLPRPVAPETWNEVKSDPFHCLGPHCPTFTTCFYHTTRRGASGAHLTLVNHALLLADLSLKIRGEAGVLPAFEVLVVDEAHHLPAMAGEHLATSFSFYECLGLVRRLLHTEGKDGGHGKGLFTLLPMTGAGEAVRAYQDAAETFFREAGWRAFSLSATPRTVRLPESFPQGAPLASALGRLEVLLGEAAQSAPTEELALEARGTAEECKSQSHRLSSILTKRWGEDHCYVVEPDVAASRRGELRASVLKALPLDASGLLARHLLPSAKTSVFTSATLSVGGDFDYFKHALGLDTGGGTAVQTLQVGSPFDYRRQVTLFLPRSMPHPRREEERYSRAVEEHVKASLKASHGKAFVLFTSFKMMRSCAEAVRGDLLGLGITLLVQGEEGWDRTKLLKVFREDVDSVLFGVNSFWEGVDVPGEALSNLILTKLPFQVPEGPLVEARHARMKAQGLQPFEVESLPEAVLKLKQGFGRLIRTSQDVGTVTILDPRVTSERWGRVFLASLPDCERVYLAAPGVPEKRPNVKSRVKNGE